MERFSIKIAPKHIIFDYSWDKKETNKLFRLVCLFWCECSYRIWQNTVLPIAEHHIQIIIRTFAILLCFSYNEFTEIKEVLI